MSARGRGTVEYTPDPQGFYQTPPSATRAILPHLGIGPGTSILEPGCGVGAIARVLRETYGDQIEIVGIEIDRQRAQRARRAKVDRAGKKHLVFDEVTRADVFEHHFAGRSFDLCLTNPSFAIWLPVAELGLRYAHATTLLIPWNSAASQKRADWWNEHPAHLRLLSRRPSFAISVKCEMAQAKRAAKEKRLPCTFQEMIPLDETPKRVCPLCQSRTVITRSDSNEYCWATWGPEITRNLWDPLPTPGEPTSDP